jgi:hypothetical protein
MAGIRQTLNYGFGSLLGNTVNMHIYGSGLFSLGQFLLNLAESRSVRESLSAVISYYVAHFLHWPWSTLLTTAGLADFLAHTGIALGLGVVVATGKYGLRA